MSLASDRSVRDLEEMERNTHATAALSSTIHPGEVIPFNVHDTSLDAHGQHVLLRVSNALVDRHFSGAETTASDFHPESWDLADGLWADASTSGPLRAGLVADDRDFCVQEYDTVPSMQGAPEYFQMDGGVWDEPGVSEWRMLPADSGVVERDAVAARANGRSISYGDLIADGFASWTAAVAFPVGRFDGVPGTCVEASADAESP